MIDELNKALEAYNAKWQKLVAGCKDKQFFESLKPTAVGWKVANEAEYQKLYGQLRAECDRTIETWMNGRWIAKLHLRDKKLNGGIEIIKLMQRRPGSTDALGLDHIDFYSPAVKSAEAILKQEPGLKWSWENNDVVKGYDWISVWFDGAEAKLKAGTVLDIIMLELEEINSNLKT